MTSGSNYRDYRVARSNQGKNCDGSTFTISGLVGTSDYKFWSGQDSPKQAVQNQQPFVFQYPLYDSRGKFIKMRTKRIKMPRGKRTPNKHLTDHPYTANISTRADSEGRGVYWCPVGPTSQMRSYITYSDGRPNYFVNKLPDLWKSEEDSAMYGKLNARLGTGFNLAVFLGEGRESLQTITQSATRIYKALKAARKGNFVKAWNELRGTRSSKLPSYVRTNPGMNRKNLADNWLQLQYGWKPLLKDIYDACKHLAYTQNRDFSRTYRVRHKKNFDGFLNISEFQIGGAASVGKTWICKVKNIDQATVLGLTDPRAVAWELMPWSFVADWFIPIGDYLQNINLRNGLSGHFVISSLRKATTTSFSSPTSDPHEGENIYFEVKDVYSDRLVQSLLPSVALPELVPLEKALTFKHCLNAVALVVSRVF